MTGHTSRGVPYALPTDTLIDYPTASLELANLLDGSVLRGASLGLQSGTNLANPAAEFGINWTSIIGNAQRGAADAPSVVGALPSQAIKINRSGIYLIHVYGYQNELTGWRQVRLKRVSDNALLGFSAMAAPGAGAAGGTVHVPFVGYYAKDDSFFVTYQPSVAMTGAQFNLHAVLLTP